MKENTKGPKEGAKKQQAKARQAAFTERQRIAGLVKWQKWVTTNEAAALDALLSQLRDGQAPNNGWWAFVVEGLRADDLVARPAAFVV